MKAIIPPVDSEVLKQELNKDRFLRHTNNGNNVLYIIDHHTAPEVMREVGRLREETFRYAGGGTGKATDIDSYDTAEKPYQQLVVWNPEEEEILGGYRFYVCDDLPYDKEGNIKLATNGLFLFSEKFVKEYLPATIELGRSFVVPRYQSRNAGKKGIYALDNLWDGLGALLKRYPHTKYFFGKVTMYTNFDKLGRDLILYFLKTFFPDPDELVRPLEALPFYHAQDELAAYFTGEDLQENLRILSKTVRQRGEFVPPLINSYINLSPTMRSFGTALNTHFGDVEETGIMIKVADIYDKKKERHVQ